MGFPCLETELVTGLATGLATGLTTRLETILATGFESGLEILFTIGLGIDIGNKSIGCVDLSLLLVDFREDDVNIFCCILSALFVISCLSYLNKKSFN